MRCRKYQLHGSKREVLTTSCPGGNVGGADLSDADLSDIRLEIVAADGANFERTTLEDFRVIDAVPTNADLGDVPDPEGTGPKQTN